MLLDAVGVRGEIKRLGFVQRFDRAGCLSAERRRGLEHDLIHGGQSIKLLARLKGLPVRGADNRQNHA